MLSIGVNYYSIYKAPQNDWQASYKSTKSTEETRKLNIDVSLKALSGAEISLHNAINSLALSRQCIENTADDCSLFNKTNVDMYITIMAMSKGIQSQLGALSLLV